jgi:pyruvate-ferredoxin/flavodoxin oxidoreductase
MGSMMETADATVDWLREHTGLRVGTLHVTAFRPFPARQVVEALRHVRAFAVLERMDNPLAESNPLTSEIKAAFAEAMIDGRVTRIPRIDSGSAGLGSRDVSPADIAAVAHNFDVPHPRRYFVLGIDHPLALSRGPIIDARPEGSFSMRGHSVGGYGSVTTNKVIATVMADLFDLHVQAFPKYGSEKKGLPTNYFLTVAPSTVRVHTELEVVDFVALNDINAFNLANPLSGLVDGGVLFVHSPRTNPEDVWADIPPSAQAQIRDHHIRVLALDTVSIAREVASTPDLMQRMQGIVLLGVFLRATPFLQRAAISDDELFVRIEKAVRKYFGRRGEAVVRDNLEVIRRGYVDAMELPVRLMQPQEVAV